MTSPMVDTVRNIPLVRDRDDCVPMTDDSGFPFDRDFDRDSRDESFRTQLDDIAKRHPEIAEHLEGFPFRSETLGRRSRPPRPEEPEFRRFTGGRPFGSARFERFGFPFGSSRDPFDDEYERFEEPKPQEQQPQQEQQPPPQQEEQKKTPERGRNKNIQQSNTVDLGQKQEPVNDRNQRSMSAPPPDNRSQQRFVSSINIPVGGMGDMGGQHSQPQQSQPAQPANKPMERVIPIHVEGRDEPVMPKHTGPSFTSQPQQPQPERIFGQRPSQFTQFVGPRQYSAGPEWHHQGFAQPQQPQQKSQPQPQPQTPQPQKFQQQAPPKREQSPPAEPQPQATSSNNPIDIIQSIQKDVSELMGQVEKFSGAPRDKHYLYLDEMLTRNLIKLDNIDTQGQENIRQARKEAIKCIEGCIGILDAKAAANVAPKPAEETKVEESPQQQTNEGMEVDTKETTESEQNSEQVVEEVAAPTEEKMEVVAETPSTEPAKETTEEKPNEVVAETKTVEEEVVAAEDNKEKDEATEEDGGDDKKEKKKGKKKVVKK